MSTLTWTFATALQRHVANLITAVRVVCLFLAAAFAVTGNALLAWVAVPLAFAALVMDWLDGYAARRLGCESEIGGLLDIVGDRIAENVWWVVFAWLHLIPLWVPLVVLSRGFVTDAIRSYALSRGRTAFGETTMMQSQIGYALVALAHEPRNLRHCQGDRVQQFVRLECRTTDGESDICDRDRRVDRNIFDRCPVCHPRDSGAMRSVWRDRQQAKRIIPAIRPRRGARGWAG